MDSVINKIKRNKKKIVKKLAIKTKALWFSASIIQENLAPNKTVEQIYEMLKFVGTQKYEEERKDK